MGVFVMTGVLVCLSAAVLGVDFGWQPLADGGVEYIIQIEPQMLDSLQDGQSLSSALPAFGHNIRRYRIVVGTADLPHHGEPLPEAPSDQPPAGQPEPETSEASRVGYEEELERVEAFGEAKPRGVANMPIESPYPSNYERSGIPLPGPILVPPLLAQERSQQPVEKRDHIAIAKPPAAPAFPTENEQGEDAEAHADEDAGASRVKPEIITAEAPEDDPAAKISLNEPSQAGDPPAIPFAPLTKHAAAKPSTVKQAEIGTEATESPSDPAPPAAEAPAEKQNPLTLIGLFASLGGNVFLLWVTTGQRSRYRALLRRSREALAAASVQALPGSHEEDETPHWETVE
jgi:hypothetical protein